MLLLCQSEHAASALSGLRICRPYIATNHRYASATYRIMFRLAIPNRSPNLNSDKNVRSTKRHRNKINIVLYITRSSADADNGLDAFSSQSRSTNMVPFHMLHIVSYCAIVTLSLKRYSMFSEIFNVFTIFVFKKFHDLEMGLKVNQGH